MPVRIYDIARRLGIKNKAVLDKAKELGITGARVPSSSLDKITAEYLENHLAGLQPAPENKELSAPPAPEPIVVVKAPQEEQEKATEPTTAEADKTQGILGEGIAAVQAAEAPAVAEGGPPKPSAQDISPSAQETGVAVVEKEPVEAEAVEEASANLAEAASEASIMEPPAPPVPKIGEKVGFIKLPPRPSSRSGKVVARGSGPGRSEGQKGRGAVARESRSTQLPPSAPAEKVPVAPAQPEVVLPADAEVIIFKPPIVVRDLAEKLNRKPYQLIADLIELKIMATVNQAIDEATARRLCAKYGFRFEAEKRERGGGIVHSHVKEAKIDQEDNAKDLELRAPVVTIMGHVDHGKTTLLDVIRKTNVAGGEAGGITQHIGAYTISVPHPDRKNDLQQITFLDTPGHAAFTAMRARGANVTDIVVLVVAADDGVMPQTVEAINHAKAAEVPILVAVNKCDHPSANPMRARQQLQERGLMPDDWGGDTIFVDVSALTKQGIDKLLEMVLLQAELLELKANPKRKAKGNVIESGIAPGGPTASVLVRTGTLHLGDTIVCGSHWGRVRALINEEGKRLKEAGPSVAVKVLGLNGVPEAGLEFNVVEDEKTARVIAGERKQQAHADRLEALASKGGASVDIFKALEDSQLKELKLVVKADTQGSVEAIVDSLNKIESEKVTLNVIHSDVGTITPTDVHLASASQALILGFHSRLESGVSDLAKHEGVQIKLYSIIYELIDEVKLAMAGMLEPEIKEAVIGVAEVRQVFELSKGGNVAGCIVNSGRMIKGKVRVLRRKNLIYEGSIQSLRRFQDEVNEVRTGLECGIRIDGFQGFEVGDTLESFTTEKVAAKL